MKKNKYDILLKIFQEVNWQLLELQKYSSENFLPVNKLFMKYYDQAKTSTEFKKEKTAYTAESEYMEIIGKIITDLQFHDIIRQKLEHIEIINNMLIKEINCKKLNEIGDFELINYTPKINDLNIAQLNLINIEYQNIIQDLKVNLNLMEDYISKVSSVNINISNHFTHTNTFENLIIILGEKLKIISEKSCQVIQVTEENFENIILKLSKVYTMQSERKVLSEVFSNEDNSNKNYSIKITEGDIEIF